MLFTLLGIVGVAQVILVVPVVVVVKYVLEKQTAGVEVSPFKNLRKLNQRCLNEFVVLDLVKKRKEKRRKKTKEVWDYNCCLEVSHVTVT